MEGIGTVDPRGTVTPAFSGPAGRQQRRSRHCPTGARLTVRFAWVLMFLLALPQVPGAQAGERVGIRAAVHPDHARLVLDWSGPVTVERRSIGGDLLLRFDRAFEADLADAGVRLASHVKALVRTEGGKGLRVRLQPGVVLGRFRQFEPDLVVVDLVSSSSRPEPAEGSTAVRVGRHDGYLRLVLDFDGPVVHRLDRDGRTRVLTFDRKIGIDAVAVAAKLRAMVSELAPLLEDRPGLVLRLRPEVEGDVFALDEDKIVIDFRNRASDEAVPARDADALPVPDRAPPAPSGRPQPGQDTSEAAALDGEPDERREGAGPHPELPAPAPATSGPAPSPRSVALHTAPTTVVVHRPEPDHADPAGERPGPVFASARTQEGIELTLTWPDQVAAAVFQRAGVLWLVFDAAPDPAWQSAPPALDPGIDRFIGPPRPNQPEAGPATILRFDLRRPLAARVEGDGQVWRILLRPDADPPAAVPVEQLHDPSRLHLLGDGAARVIRVDDPLVGDELLVWPLRTSGAGLPKKRDFVQVQLLPTAQGVVLRKTADGVEVRGSEGALEVGARGGLHLSISAERAEREVATVAGKAAGSDERTVRSRIGNTGGSGAPRPASPGEQARSSASGGGRGRGEAVDGSARSAGFAGSATVPAAPRAAEEVPHSATPVVAEPDRPIDLPPLPAPGLSDREADPGPDLQTEGEGERARRADPRPEDRAEPVADGSASRADAGPPLRLAGWALSEHETLQERRARLMRRIEDAESPLRDAARLDLARFFLAQAMAAETLAVLDGAEPRDPALSSRALARQSLTGAAELLMGRLLAAEQALDTPALDSDPEVALWRAAIAAARNDWEGAAAELGRSENTLMSYPPALQLRLGLPAAMIAVEAGQSEHAFEILGRVGMLDLHRNDRAQLNFIQGLAHARTGDLDRAAEIWRAVERKGDEETRLKANYALATTLFGAERIGADEALGQLLPNRPLWRGHAWEVSMLDGLATIQMAAGDPAGAIRSWRDGLRLHPVAATRMGLEDKTRSAFRTALSADSVNPLAPVTALALYRSHPELMPAGEDGRDLRRRLAERLSELDLIEPARDLMQAVLKDLPPGPTAARDGAVLAALQLREPDPAAALTSLDVTQAEALREDLAGERVVLRAAALDGTGRTQEAIALLEGRTDPVSRELMIDLLWRTQDWPRLAASLERSLKDLSVADGTSLAPDEQVAIVKLAIAHAQLDRTDELDRMVRRFGPAMRGRPAEAAFLMATSPDRRATAPATILAMAGRQMKSIRAYLTQR